MLATSSNRAAEIEDARLLTIVYATRVNECGYRVPLTRIMGVAMSLSEERCLGAIHRRLTEYGETDGHRLSL